MPLAQQQSTASAPTISIANNYGHRAMLRICGKPKITMSAFYYNISLVRILHFLQKYQPVTLKLKNSEGTNS